MEDEAYIGVSFKQEESDSWSQVSDDALHGGDDEMDGPPEED